MLVPLVTLALIEDYRIWRIRTNTRKNFLKISQNSQEKIYAGVSFSINLQGSGLQLYWKRDSGTGVFLCTFWNILENLFIVHFRWLLLIIRNHCLQVILKSFKNSTFWNKNLTAGVLLLILRNSLDKLFCRTPPTKCLGIVELYKLQSTIKRKSPIQLKHRVALQTADSYKLKPVLRIKMIPWIRCVNWSHIRRSENVQEVFWTFYERFIR